MKKYQNFFATLIFAISTIFSINAQAGPCLASTNSDICIEEELEIFSLYQRGRYTVTNNGSIPILSFGVTNPDSIAAYALDDDRWTGQRITQSEWDEGVALRILSTSLENTSFENGNYFTYTKDLGSYAELFGNEEKVVNFYYFNNTNYTNPLPPEGTFVIDDYLPAILGITTGQTLDEFGWNSQLPYSNIAAFGPNGQLLAQTPSVASSVSAVPIPAALPLMASALAIFGIARRNKAA